MFQTPPLPEGDQGESMMDLRKRRAQTNLPRPQMNAIPDEFSEIIAMDARLVRELGWEDFVK